MNSSSFIFSIFAGYALCGLFVLFIVYIILLMIKKMFFNEWLASKERMFTLLNSKKEESTGDV